MRHKVHTHKERKCMKITYSEPERNSDASASAKQAAMHRPLQIRLFIVCFLDSSQPELARGKQLRAGYSCPIRTFVLVSFFQTRFLYWKIPRWCSKNLFPGKCSNPGFFSSQELTFTAHASFNEQRELTALDRQGTQKTKDMLIAYVLSSSTLNLNSLCTGLVIERLRVRRQNFLLRS